MPSIRTLLVGLLATAFVQSVVATPIPASLEADCEPTETTPTIPAVSGMPTTNLTLQYVAIGRGIQNYTCSAVGATPVSDGAVATLFDATALARFNEAALHAIPAKIVYLPLPKSSLSMTGGIYPILGHHYFDAKLTPTFDLTSVKKILYGAKTADIKAPTTADVGPAGTGAVDWLQLQKKVNYTSVDMAMVYRVETAGGQPTNCTSTAIMSVQYAAEYWFYN